MVKFFFKFQNKCIVVVISQDLSLHAFFSGNFSSKSLHFAEMLGLFADLIIIVMVAWGGNYELLNRLYVALLVLILWLKRGIKLYL